MVHPWKIVSVLVSIPVLVACSTAIPETTSPETQIAATQPTQTQPAASATPAPTLDPDLPRFEPGDCPVQSPRGYDVTCGMLLVPESRTNPTWRVVRLPIMILHSFSENPLPDPVVHLVGGPGGSVLDSVAYYLERGGHEILKKRDYILFNQRGTRYALPELDCPASHQMEWAVTEQNIPEAEGLQHVLNALVSCHDQWAAEGIDLGAYDSVENAADVNDLRITLGYDKVNLYGVSYGTRLALTVMRDHPEGLRSVILDSVYPPQVDLYSSVGVNAGRSLSLLFERCAADPVCNTAYPDLERVFYETADLLDADPPVMTLSSEDGQPYQYIVTGERFINAIFAALYRSDIIPRLPDAIYQVYEGRYYVLQPYIRMATGSLGISNGMYYAVQCSEEIPFDTYENALAAQADIPQRLRDVFAVQAYYDLCAHWQAGPLDPNEEAAITSTIPTLVVAGEMDPITPPAWAELAAKTLPASYLFTFPDQAHGVIRADDCARSIFYEFLDNPSQRPEAACMVEGS